MFSFSTMLLRFKYVYFHLYIITDFLPRCLDFAAEDKVMDHQPIYIYKKDPYMQVEENGHLPDVVIQGVLMGLYGSTH